MASIYPAVAGFVLVLIVIAVVLALGTSLEVLMAVYLLFVYWAVTCCTDNVLVGGVLLVGILVLVVSRAYNRQYGDGLTHRALSLSLIFATLALVLVSATKSEVTCVAAALVALAAVSCDIWLSWEL